LASLNDLGINADAIFVSLGMNWRQMRYAGVSGVVSPLPTISHDGDKSFSTSERVLWTERLNTYRAFIPKVSLPSGIPAHAFLVDNVAWEISEDGGASWIPTRIMAYTHSNAVRYTLTLVSPVDSVDSAFTGQWNAVLRFKLRSATGAQDPATGNRVLTETESQVKAFLRPVSKADGFEPRVGSDESESEYHGYCVDPNVLPSGIQIGATASVDFYLNSAIVRSASFYLSEIMRSDAIAASGIKPLTPIRGRLDYQR